LLFLKGSLDRALLIGLEVMKGAKLGLLWEAAALATANICGLPLPNGAVSGMLFVGGLGGPWSLSFFS
jgi:hypothetical protein